MSAAPVPGREPRTAWGDEVLTTKRVQQHESISAWDSVPVEVAGASSAGSKQDWLQALGRSSYRLLEIVVAILGLVLTFPIALVLAWLIKRDSPGPAVFKQKRVAKNGGTFAFYKFRTLYVDARQRWPELYAYRYSPQDIETKPFKNDEDPRVTNVGKWLRRTTLDEIPNLYNLLRGDVTLVGPRPEIPEMLPYYRPEELIKFSVKPGLTGLAQTTGRNRLTMRQTIDWDVYYVRNRSWHLDVSILLTTIKRVLTRDGAL